MHYILSARLSMYLHTLRALMSRVVSEARFSAATFGEVPVGAAIVCDGSIVAVSGNRVVRDGDRSAHSEIVAIREASKMFSGGYLSQCDMYVTLEPCPMCAYALLLARIRRVYFGAYNSIYSGECNNSCLFNSSFSTPEVYGGIMEKECSSLMLHFFCGLRGPFR